MSFPVEFKYTKDHEYINVKNGEGAVGLTNYAQDQLGDIVFVELPEVGQELALGDVFAVVESVKAVSDCYSPTGGTVIRVNERLLDEPELIEDPNHRLTEQTLFQQEDRIKLSTGRFIRSRLELFSNLCATMRETLPYLEVFDPAAYERKLTEPDPYVESLHAMLRQIKEWKEG